MQLEQWLFAALKEGGTLAVAVISLWMLNKVWTERLAEQVRHTEAEKAAKQEYKDSVDRLSKVIDENTRVISVFLDRTRPRASSKES